MKTPTGWSRPISGKSWKPSPHFCSARTLVGGLKDVLGNGIKGLICPLQDLVSHSGVYGRWTDNVGLQVQQYSALSAFFKRLLQRGESTGISIWP